MRKELGAFCEQFHYDMSFPIQIGRELNKGQKVKTIKTNSIKIQRIRQYKK